MSLDLPPVTRNLLIANIVVFALQQMFGDMLMQYFALWPWGPDRVFRDGMTLVSIGFRPWQVVTYAFMHGSFSHIAFNMLALFMFGGAIERTFGAPMEVLEHLGMPIVVDGGDQVRLRPVAG